MNVVTSLNDIITAMDSAIKEFWKNYDGMMVATGRVFGDFSIKRCLSEDLDGLLNELESLVPLKFRREGDKIVVERCIVKRLIEEGVIDKDNTLCPFVRGFITKVLESVGVKADCKNCEISVRS